MCRIGRKHRMRGMEAKAQNKKEKPMTEYPVSLCRLTPLVLVLVAACETTSPPMYSNPTPTQAVKSSSDAVDTPEWLRQRDYRNGGPLPPMEANRVINEQSCTQGVDLTAGNLMCR